jgi:hypothetical protein
LKLRFVIILHPLKHDKTVSSDEKNDFKPGEKPNEPGVILCADISASQNAFNYHKEGGNDAVDGGTCDVGFSCHV